MFGKKKSDKESSKVEEVLKRQYEEHYHELVNYIEKDDQTKILAVSSMQLGLERLADELGIELERKNIHTIKEEYKKEHEKLKEEKQRIMSKTNI